MLDKIIRILREKTNRTLKETMLIIFLCGILLFVILIPTEKTSGDYSYMERKKEKTIETQLADNSDTSDINKYKSTLEKELENFLTCVSGVGEVKVLIYMKDSQEYIVEKDNPTASSKDSDSSEETKDETTVYTKNDAGYEVPFVTQTISPSIDGVVVAAKGAANEAVRFQIVKLVMALYGIEANKVEVLVMG